MDFIYIPSKYSEIFPGFITPPFRNLTKYPTRLTRSGTLVRCRHSSNVLDIFDNPHYYLTCPFCGWQNAVFIDQMKGNFTRCRTCPAKHYLNDISRINPVSKAGDLSKDYLQASFRLALKRFPETEILTGNPYI